MAKHTARSASKRSGLKRVAKFVAQPARSAKFVRRGLRSFFEYRDLGIAKATGGRYHAVVVRATGPGNQSTGIHFHDLDFQLIYILKGWLKAQYRGQGIVKLEAGTCLHNPPGNAHNVFQFSKDLEFLEVTCPADYPTVDVQAVEGPGSTRPVSQRGKMARVKRAHRRT